MISVKKISAAAAVLLMLGVYGKTAYAALSGTGTEADPVTGEAKAGDIFAPGSYVCNLTSENLAVISLEGIYEAKEYQAVFDAAGGVFPDGKSTREITVKYDSVIPHIDDPENDGKIFAGWYLKGNGQATADDAPAILKEGCIYRIANDDTDDMALAEKGGDGQTLARAIWRAAGSASDDGMEADDPAGGIPESRLDPWSGKNNSNSVIEWISGLPDRDAYRSAHGRTAYQYGRVILSAETDPASAYEWYVKKKDSDKFVRLDEDGPVLKLYKLGRNDNGNVYRCDVTIDGSEKLSYETELTVYHLPEIIRTDVFVNGGEVRHEA